MTQPMDQDASYRAEKRTTLHQAEWKVRRYGRIEEVEHANGRLTYRVKIWDHGRQAFTTQNFNDQVPAMEFLDKVQRENEEAFNDG